MADLSMDDELTEFYQIRKHFLIMSEAGKPIYTLYGDEENLSPFFATVSAIVPKIQSFFVTVAEREQKNQLKWVASKNFDAAFLKKGNLIYICLITRKEHTLQGTQFIDEAYQKSQITKLYGSSSKISLTQHHHPSQYQIGWRKKKRESNTYIRKQMEYLHLQFISLVTGNVNAQLSKKPNLDIKTTITGLERTMDMMCDISQKSPSVFL